MAPRYKSSLRALGCVYTDSSSMIKNPDIFPREYYENSLEFHVRELETARENDEISSSNEDGFAYFPGL